MVFILTRIVKTSDGRSNLIRFKYLIIPSEFYRRILKILRQGTSPISGTCLGPDIDPSRTLNLPLHTYAGDSFYKYREQTIYLSLALSLFLSSLLSSPIEEAYFCVRYARVQVSTHVRYARSRAVRQCDISAFRSRKRCLAQLNNATVTEFD